MPQLSILPDRPSMQEVVVTVTAPEPPREATVVAVKIRCKGDRHPKSVWIATLPGIETDYLATLVEEAVMAWAYGESTRDVVQACAGVKHAAQAHRRKHEF